MQILTMALTFVSLGFWGLFAYNGLYGYTFDAMIITFVCFGLMVMAGRKAVR